MSGLVFNYKHVDENGDITEAKVWKVPISESNPEGISYSMVYIRKGKRIIGYDNEGHGKPGSHHHKHINERIIPYNFVDEWKLAEDFAEDIERIKRGVLK